MMYMYVLNPSAMFFCSSSPISTTHYKPVIAVTHMSLSSIFPPFFLSPILATTLAVTCLTLSVLLRRGNSPPWKNLTSVHSLSTLRTTLTLCRNSPRSKSPLLLPHFKDLAQYCTHYTKGVRTSIAVTPWFLSLIGFFTPRLLD